MLPARQDARPAGPGTIARPPVSDRPPPQPAPEERPELFVTKDRAKRIAFRLDGIARERSLYYGGERVGMTSFAEAVPALLEIETDLATTVDLVLRGRLRDRERGETEIPLVVALEGVLERVARARGLEERRRANRVDAAWAQRKLLALLADASRRLDAFVRLYDERRLLPVPAAVDLTHVLLRVEEDAAVDRCRRPRAAGGRAALAPGRPPGADAHLVRPTRSKTCLRAARAEVATATPPWRLERASPTAPVGLAIGETGGREASFGRRAGRRRARAGPPPRRGRRARPRCCASRTTISVERTRDADGATTGLRVTLADRGAAGRRRARARPTWRCSPAVDGAVRAYLSAAARVDGPARHPSG